eukprot:13237759-Alexandrium_andersonii.AAC.1
MSASLVGSEMCIRDRSNSFELPQAAQHSLKQLCRHSEAVASACRRFWAVARAFGVRPKAPSTTKTCLYAPTTA